VLGTVHLPEYVAGAALIVLLPGPNSLYVLSVAARRGVRTGYRAAAGVFLGDTTLITLTSLGAASLLARWPLAFDAVKYMGAAYLAFLGVGMLRSALRSLRERRRADADPHAAADAQPSAAASVPPERPFRRALVVSLLNPKAILFFLAFFTQFVDPAYPRPAVTFALLGVIIQAFSVLYLSTLILGGDRLAGALRRRKRLSASMTGGVGTLFLGFAAKLATATLR
jgi:leucine efflux protein